VIDPHAVVHPNAKIGTEVSVGAFSIVGPDVELGDGTWIGPHVVIQGRTTIGKGNKIYQFCSIGDAPQHVGYKGEDTRLAIGDRNIIRENCTINRGTDVGRGVTTIANDNFIMAYVHIAHDCNIGSHTIFANCASLAGHVEVGNYAVLGGFTLVHQFCRIGEHCITGIGTVCLKDVPPYIVAAGNTVRPYGVNVKGLQRRNFSDQTIAELQVAYKIVYRSNLTLRVAIEKLEQKANCHIEVQKFVEFLKHSKRSITR